MHFKAHTQSSSHRVSVEVELDDRINTQTWTGICEGRVEPKIRRSIVL